MTKRFLQYVEIESKPIVGHDALPCDKGFHLGPHSDKCGCLSGGLGSDPVNRNEIIPVVVAGRLDQKAQLSDDDSRFNPHQPNLADAGSGILGCLKVDCSKGRSHWEGIYGFVLGHGPRFLNGYDATPESLGGFVNSGVACGRRLKGFVNLRSDVFGRDDRQRGALGENPPPELP